MKAELVEVFVIKQKLEKAPSFKRLKQPSRAGFTIVELLIVIVVIGILAAITIVAYNGVTSRAIVASLSSDLESSAKQLAMDQTLNSAYPATVAAANNGAGLKASPGTTYQYTVNNTANPQTFCITATNGTTSYFVSNTSNTPTNGACPGQGANGVAAITNLILNPSFESGTSGWSYRWYGNTGGAGLNTRQTSGGYAGASYLRKTWTVGGAASDNGFNSNNNSTGLATVVASNNYSISGYMRTNRSNYQATIGVTWYDSSGVVIGSAINWYSSTPPLPANSWTRVTQVVTSPVGAASAIVYLSNVIGITWAVGDTLDLDATMMTQGSTLYNYADGNSPNWIWNGTPNASTSTGSPL